MILLDKYVKFVKVWNLNWTKTIPALVVLGETVLVTIYEIYLLEYKKGFEELNRYYKRYINSFYSNKSQGLSMVRISSTELYHLLSIRQPKFRLVVSCARSTERWDVTQ